jgi:hypothetical protein
MSSPTSATSAAHETGAQDQQRSAVDAASRTTKGVILRQEEGVVVFRPIDTSYEHHLIAPAGFSAEVGRNVRAVIRVKARKVYTVMSGGNFVQPILGQPRIIQGRVTALEGGTLYVKAASLFAVELPTGRDSIDMANGEFAINSLVNVVALPGAAIEIR